MRSTYAKALMRKWHSITVGHAAEKRYDVPCYIYSMWTSAKNHMPSHTPWSYLEFPQNDIMYAFFQYVKTGPLFCSSNCKCMEYFSECRDKSVSVARDQWPVLTLKVLVATIDAKWEGMGDVGSARYEPALLPPCTTIRVLSYSN